MAPVAGRIRAELFDQGVCASNKRIARLMRLAMIRGLSRRRGFIVTTMQDPGLARAPDLVRRCFLAEAPNPCQDRTRQNIWPKQFHMGIIAVYWCAVCRQCAK